MAVLEKVHPRGQAPGRLTFKTPGAETGPTRLRMGGTLENKPPLRTPGAETGPTRFRRRVWILAGMLMLLLMPAQIKGELQEYEVKAAFLFNFAQFCEWPKEAFASTNSPMVIGILGQDHFGEALDGLIRDESIAGHKLEVRRFRSVSDVRECQLLFVSRSESSRVDRILAGLQGRPILTVSDIDRFAFHGGMIRLYTDQKKIRLRINIAEVRKAGLNINSKVLNLAEIVQDSKGD
jgi:hypothetical protein